MSSIALDNQMMKPASGPKEVPKNKASKEPKESASGSLKYNDPLKDFKIPKVSERRRDVQFI